MQKNVASQKWRVFAFDRTDNSPKTGDAANITAKICKDWGTKDAVTDTNPTEIEDGYYEFDLTQSETNANNLDLYPESSTTDIQVIGVPGNYVTTVIAGATMDANLVSIDGELTNGNNATLYLKALDIQNDSGPGINVAGTTYGIKTDASAGPGLYVEGGGAATGAATFVHDGLASGYGMIIQSGDGGAGLEIRGYDGDAPGLNIYGNGDGSGIDIAAGATGNGIDIDATAGNGIDIDTADGEGIDVRSANGTALYCEGNGADESGASFVTGTAASGYGITCQSGAGGAAMRLKAWDGGGNSKGLDITGYGTEPAVSMVADADNGLEITAGSNGTGIIITGAGSGNGITITAGATGDGIGVYATAGDAVLLQANDGDGLYIQGGTNGNGIYAIGAGTGAGIHGKGGTTGNGVICEKGASGSKDIDADEIDDIKTVTDNNNSGIIDANIVQIDDQTDGVTNLQKGSEAVVYSSAKTGTLTKSAMTTNLTELDDDHYNGLVCKFITGNLAGQAAVVSDYTGATKLITFEDDLTEAPANGDEFVLL